MARADGNPSKRQKTLPQLISEYYDALKDLAHQNVMYEMGMRPAFHALLQAEGKKHGWTLIAEHEKKVNGRTIRPDGTFKDHANLVRGYWEAKDTSDKLETEIEKKRKAGYPLNNIILVLPAFQWVRRGRLTWRDAGHAALPADSGID